MNHSATHLKLNIANQLYFYFKKFISSHFRLPLILSQFRMPNALFTTNHALPSADIVEKEEVAHGEEGHGALGRSETFFSFLFSSCYFQFNSLAIPLCLLHVPSTG